MSRETSVREHIIPIEIEDDVIMSDSAEESQSPVLSRKRTNIQCSTTFLDGSFEESEKIKLDLSEHLAQWNYKEKIILVIDRAQDDSFTPFKLRNESLKPFEMVGKAVGLFLQMKQMIDNRHEFAVVFLTENSAVWALNFTSNIKSVVDMLSNTSECNTEDIFNLNSLFDVIMEKVSLPLKEEQPPAFVVRTILFYGRSYTLPTLKMTENIQQLLDCPHFTMDVLMTHEPVDTDNNCNKIFQLLQNLDKKGLTYFFPVARDSRDLMNSMAKLLGHPMQRAPQKQANYAFAVQV